MKKGLFITIPNFICLYNSFGLVMSVHMVFCTGHEDCSSYHYGDLVV